MRFYLGFERLPLRLNKDIWAKACLPIFVNFQRHRNTRIMQGIMLGQLVIRMHRQLLYGVTLVEELMHK